MDKLLLQIKQRFPRLNFVAGDDFVWSSRHQTVTYKYGDNPENQWALIHETAHASLGHSNYQTDQHLLVMELEAWKEAKIIAKSLKVTIDQDHIEDCLDTYRDWLHKRSTCPQCDVVGSQNSARHYKCFNCQCTWQVPSSPLCKINKKRISVINT